MAFYSPLNIFLIRDWLKGKSLKRFFPVIKNIFSYRKIRITFIQLWRMLKIVSKIFLTFDVGKFDKEKMNSRNEGFN